MVSARVEAWRDRGRYVEVGGHSIFVVERDGAGTPIVVVHGYQGSSHDFAQVVDGLDRGHGPTLLASRWSAQVWCVGCDG